MKYAVQLKGIDVVQGDRTILQAVSLHISHSEFVYLIGKTGSGKTSLLKVLYAALPIHVGQGMVAGFELEKLNRKTIPLLRRKLGIVFQDFNLLTDRSVEDNLYFALRASGHKDKVKMDRRVAEVLEQTGLEGYRPVKPHLLSGGEQQRLAIARALLNKPELIIADEPTGNLDPETADDILLLLRDLARENDSAIILATHDYRLLDHFPARIVRCINKRIVDDQEVARFS